MAYYFFYGGVSLHLQTKVLSGAQAGISRCRFPSKPADDKPQREMPLACAAVVAKYASLEAMLYVGC